MRAARWRVAESNDAKHVDRSQQVSRAVCAESSFVVAGRSSYCFPLYVHIYFMCFVMTENRFKLVVLVPRSCYLFLAAQVSGMSLDLVRKFPTVTTLNLGGGYKVRLGVCDCPTLFAIALSPGT